MKYIEVDNDFFPVSDQTEVVADFADEHVTINPGRGLEPKQVFWSSDLELPFTPTVHFGMVKWFAGCLVQARLAAKLAAPHVSMIHDDHDEFITCILLEQQKHLMTVTELTMEYVRDWQQIAASRVTGYRFVRVGADRNARYVIRRSGESPYMEQAPDRTYWNVFLDRERTRVIGSRVVYSGSPDNCEVAMRKFATVPWQETITSIELDRWIARQKVPCAPTAPTRAIRIPETPARAANEVS